MKTPKIKPRGKQVLVVPDGEESRVSEHGLVTPGNVEQEKKAIGTVVAVGPEIKDMKKGDRVIFGVFAGERIRMRESAKEVDYILLFDEDILALIE
jgi:chaperonin GroES